MIHHIGFRVADLDKSVEFYLKALASIGYVKVMAFPGVQALGAKNMPDLWLSQLKEDEERKPVKDLHLAFAAENTKQVDEFHSAALAAGGKCNGKPGPRPEYTKTYYGAFVFDPEGNNLEVVYMAPGDGCDDPK